MSALRTLEAKVDAAEPTGPGDVPAWVRVIVPLALGVAVIGFWEFAVYYWRIPKFIFPAPSMVVEALIADFPVMMASLWSTLTVTLSAFFIAAILGISAAVLFTQSKVLEIALFPYAVILQVTPVVSIAPFILIWVGLDHADRALLILATIVAFFPILSNTTLGLKSVDHNLRNLFDLYHASRIQRLKELEFPSALPHILGGLKISGGLALIGAVVAEFVAGSGTSTGLAWRIVESANRLNIPRMFAALLLLSLLGITIFFSLAWIENRLLHKWHESAARRES